MWWTLLLGIVAAVGLALTLLGLRGRRADDHPLCRRCGFDLFGNPDATICTECGADLTRPMATKIGHRARRRLPLTLGLSLLVPCLVVAGVVGYAVIRGIDAQAYKPAWLLARELRSADVPTRDAAFAELEKRLTTGKLSDAATADTVAWALDAQGDPAATWDQQWGDFVTDARAAGKVGDEPWQRFARQAFIPTLRARPDLRQGDPLPVQIELNRRLGRNATWQVYVTTTNGRLDGEPVDLGGIRGGMTFRGGGGMSSRFLNKLVVPGGRTAALKTGPSRVAADVELVIGPQLSGGAGRNPPDSADDVAAVVRANHSLETPLRLRGRDEPANWVTTDESLWPKVEAGVWVSPLRLASEADVNTVTWLKSHPWELGVRTVLGPGDTPLEYQIVIRRADGSEAVLPDDSGMSTSSTTAVVVTKIDGYQLSSEAVPAATAGRNPMAPVTIILRPDLDAIARRIDPTPVWGKDVVFENVPLRRMEDEQPGRDWQAGPWHAPGGTVIDPDAKFYANRPPTSRPATRAAGSE